MKKFLYGFLTCLCVVTCVVTVQRVSKSEKKLKKKSSASELLSMKLPSELPFQKINGLNPEKIIESIKSFPCETYQLFSIPKNGYFYLDEVSDLIKTHMKRGGTWESHIQDLIRKYALPGSTVLDIGAHIGTHTLIMSKAVGTEGHVLAFEPQPKTFRELFLNMAINDLSNISFYWAGVGDRLGNIELGPMYEANEGGAGLYGGTGQTVQLLTVDSLHLSNVSLMKIDVEGMEEQVLAGARETILANRPVIIIEIIGGHDIGEPSKEIRQKILHTINMLEDMGYKVQQLWRHDWIAIPLDKSQ